MLRSLPDLNIKQNRTRVTISIVRRTLCHDPRSYQIQQLQRTQYVVPTRLVARLRLLALRGKERSSTNWEWLEVAVPVQDTRPHLSWDRTTFFFIGATRPHLLTITTFFKIIKLLQNNWSILVATERLPPQPFRHAWLISWWIDSLGWWLGPADTWLQRSEVADRI